MLSLYSFRAYTRREHSRARRDIIPADTRKAVISESQYSTGQYPKTRPQPLLSYQENFKIEENEYAYVEEYHQHYPYPPASFQNTLNRSKEQTAMEYGFAANMLKPRGHYAKGKTAERPTCRALRGDKTVFECTDAPQ